MRSEREGHDIDPQTKERAFVERYFTNADGRICAIRPAMSPGLAATLITRFSRATETDIRRIFLQEFVGADSQILPVDESHAEVIDEERARKMRKRILDQYGDDSVREQAGGYVVIHDASVLCSMTVLRSHPLLTGIEASTRYIDWTQKDSEGNYRYVTPAEIKGTPDGELYKNTNTMLFDTYVSLYEPLLSHIRATTPRTEDQSERAYAASIRAKALDSLRRLLPLSSKTNFGIFANYRTLSEMIMNLSASESPEAVETAQGMYEELMRVNPEFVEVSRSNHSVNWIRFIKETEGLAREFGLTYLRSGTLHVEEGVYVDVLTKDPRYAVTRALLSHHFPGLSEGEYYAAYLRAERENGLDTFLTMLSQQRTNRRHKLPDTLDTITVRLGMHGISLADYKDLNRHRRIHTKTLPDLSGTRGFQTPVDIVNAGLEKPYSEAQERALLAMNQLSERQPIAAQMLLTHGSKTSFEITTGLVGAMWISELRSIASGDPSYRAIAQDLWVALTQALPEARLLTNFVDYNDYALGRIGEAVRADLRGSL